MMTVISSSDAKSNNGDTAGSRLTTSIADASEAAMITTDVVLLGPEEEA
jgi:hypothetical protein